MHVVAQLGCARYCTQIRISETLQMRRRIPCQWTFFWRNAGLAAQVKAAHMSGLEVAGIVLGALPLIIYALENLRDGASRLGRLINFNAEYSKTWGEVEDEELMYRLQLKRLLKPLVRDDVLTDDDLEALLLDASANSWKEPDLDNALKARLGESYDRYIANVEDIQTLAWEILRPLVQSSAFQERINNHNASSLAQMSYLYKSLTSY
jgi:hypothetical protein